MAAVRMRRMAAESQSLAFTRKELVADEAWHLRGRPLARLRALICLVHSKCPSYPYLSRSARRSPSKCATLRINIDTPVVRMDATLARILAYADKCGLRAALNL